jgi:hypothetical protein
MKKMIGLDGARNSELQNLQTSKLLNLQTSEPSNF